MKNTKSMDNALVLDSNQVLLQKDSLLIENYLLLVARVDTAFSDSKCAETIQFYNKTGSLILRKSIQHCMADSRMKWRQDSYFGMEGKPLLEIAYDGTRNVIKVNRSYHF